MYRLSIRRSLLNWIAGVGRFYTNLGLLFCSSAWIWRPSCSNLSTKPPLRLFQRAFHCVGSKYRCRGHRNSRWIHPIFSRMYLVDDSLDGDDPEKLIKKNFKVIFEEVLAGWYTDEEAWPKKMDHGCLSSGSMWRCMRSWLISERSNRLPKSINSRVERITLLFCSISCVRLQNWSCDGAVLVCKLIYVLRVGLAVPSEVLWGGGIE